MVIHFAVSPTMKILFRMRDKNKFTRTHVCIVCTLYTKHSNRIYCCDDMTHWELWISNVLYISQGVLSSGNSQDFTYQSTMKVLKSCSILFSGRCVKSQISRQKPFKPRKTQMLIDCSVGLGTPCTLWRIYCQILWLQRYCIRLIYVLFLVLNRASVSCASENDR